MSSKTRDRNLGGAWLAKPLPRLPKIATALQSPPIVRFCDSVRFQADQPPEMDEFLWFIREYPRLYRRHVDHIDHRLANIHTTYTDFHRRLCGILTQENPIRFGGSATFDADVNTIFWDFEALLSATGSALDILVRIVGTAFREQTPPNFNKLRTGKRWLGDPIIGILEDAFAQWVERLKAYRDCFVHYTPIDTLLTIRYERYADGIETRRSDESERERKLGVPIQSPVRTSSLRDRRKEEPPRA